VVLLACACSVSPRIGVLPPVGEYECERTEQFEIDGLTRWTYNLSLRERAECWVTPFLHGAINGGFTPVGRWEHHVAKEGPDRVTVFRDARDASPWLHLEVVGSGEELRLVRDEVEWHFYRVRRVAQ